MQARRELLQTGEVGPCNAGVERLCEKWPELERQCNAGTDWLGNNGPGQAQTGKTVQASMGLVRGAGRGLDWQCRHGLARQ